MLIVFTAWIQPEKNHYKQGLYDKLFTPIAMMEKDGFAVTFLIDLQYLLVEKPAGYSAAEEAAVLDQYARMKRFRTWEFWVRWIVMRIICLISIAFSSPMPPM